MLVQRHVLLITAIASTSLILLQFQNCGPASTTSQASGTTSGDVHLVDDYSKAEIQFVSEDVQIHDEAEQAAVDGLCNRSRSGAQLSWALVNEGEATRPLLSGNSLCQSGQFHVQVPELLNLVCGVSHLVVVEGDWGGSTFTHLIRRCQPLASQPLEAPQGTPYGTECSMEYQPAHEAGQQCLKVCYREQKVVLEEALSKDQCSGLADQLAGP
jgi:hypothetical protein